MNLNSLFEDLNKGLSELYPDYDLNSDTNETGTFECPFPGCGKIYRYKSEHKRHLITHEKAKNYKCSYPDCTKSFKRPDALKVHMQSHSKKPEYICPVPICPKQFNDIPTLKYHLSNEHPAEMKLIGNSFEFQQVLPNQQQYKYLDANSESPLLQTEQFFQKVRNRDRSDSLNQIYNSSPSIERSVLEEDEDLISPESRKIFCTEREKRDTFLLNTVSPCSSQKNDSNADEISSIKSACERLLRENQELKTTLEKMTGFAEK